MEYRQYLPPKELRDYVRYFWSFESSETQVKSLWIKSFADRFPRLIFQNLNGFEPLRNLQQEQLPICYLSGVDTQHTDAIMGGAFSHFGVSFYPHALPAFFEVGADQLTNTMPDIQFFCNSQIQHRLEKSKTHSERVKFMCGYLYKRLHASRQKDLLVNQIIQYHGVDDMISLYGLSKKYQVSERQLQRRFKSSVGISHKRFQRILRFEKALPILAQADYTQLTSIAYELGYTDQSHFIKDFTEFSGMPPYAFVKSNSVGSECSSFIYVAD